MSLMVINIVSLLILLPLLGGSIIRWKEVEKVEVEIIGMVTNILATIVAIVMWLGYDSGIGGYQYISKGGLVGVDGISIMLIIMTTIVITMVILAGPQERNYMSWVLWSEGILIGIFSTLDIRYFYIGYEMILIPLYYIMSESKKIYNWRVKKIETAIRKLVSFTLIGSFLMLISLILVWNFTEELNTIVLRENIRSLDNKYIKLLWVSLIIAFAVKIPIWPIHSWLPMAHSESPTGGSMILAGVVLKMGTYGIIRYVYEMIPTITEEMRNKVIVIGIISLVYSGIMIIRQVEIKKFIAYSSISHMNLALVGLFSGSPDGFLGCVLIMINHGIVSTGLFYLAGTIINRYKMRAIKYYRGLLCIMPLFSSFWILLNMANIGFPPFGSFIGELVVYIGIMENSISGALAASIGIIISGCYGIWMITKVTSGKLNYFSHIASKLLTYKQSGLIILSNDLLRKEFYVLLSLVLFSLGLGIFPNIVLI